MDVLYCFVIFLAAPKASPRFVTWADGVAGMSTFGPSFCDSVRWDKTCSDTKEGTSRPAQRLRRRWSSLGRCPRWYEVLRGKAQINTNVKSFTALICLMGWQSDTKDSRHFFQCPLFPYPFLPWLWCLRECLLNCENLNGTMGGLTEKKMEAPSWMLALRTWITEHAQIGLVF